MPANIFDIQNRVEYLERDINVLREQIDRILSIVEKQAELLVKLTNDLEALKRKT